MATPADASTATPSSPASPELHVPANPVRFVTAASLFDGHDASINIMRRILQAQGAEVIHLGHNRSVEDVVRAALQEDVQGIAISSYQGGHVEYFTYLLDRLRDEGIGDIRVYGGGGGVIVPAEIELLESLGVAKIFSPQDGQQLGLRGMINLMIADCDHPLPADVIDPAQLLAGSQRALARTITLLENDGVGAELTAAITSAASARQVPVLGITGTGGSGKSSLTDELLRRFRLDQSDKLKIAVIAVDPTRRRGGGALLGDRIRMNAIDSPNIFFRSLATRGAGELPACTGAVIDAAKAWGADLVIVETPGIGQGDAAIVPFVDVPMYVMTPEFGAASQLEKIDMLDFAEIIVINKFERRGAEDALRDVRRQYTRNR
ncbi:MAG: cobalamin-dependent protein, partial [Ilumatobacteraceae bacterium]